MPLKVLAFTPLPEAGAASRYRVFQWCEPLRALGIELHPAPFFDPRAFARLYSRAGTLRKAWDLARLTSAHLARLKSAARYDLAFVHRELWPLAGEWPLKQMREVQPKWVFDLDDAVFLPNSSDANRYLMGLKSHHSVSSIAAGACAVSAGNAWLADWARGERPGQAAETVEVIPTAVDSDLWIPAARSEEGPVRLVWIGTPSTLRYLEDWGPSLSRLGARHPSLELHVIGSQFELPGLRCFSHDWSAGTERSIAQRCHIGLAPLGDGKWERGKCGLKLLLYMALGLPAVASDTGVHPSILTRGEDGELVTNGENLEATLERLIGDSARRQVLGRTARATLERHFSVRALAPRLADLLLRAAG